VAAVAVLSSFTAVVVVVVVVVAAVVAVCFSLTAVSADFFSASTVVFSAVVA
jgi:hypothetical protein